jgi:anti-anti-sigma factor
LSRLEGELGFGEVGRWLEQADALAAAPGGELDLSEVGRIDSAGAALLLEICRRAQATGRALRVRNANAQVRSLLEFLELEAVLGLA